MASPIEPGDAAAALAEVRRQESRVIGAAIVPRWFWWVVGAASVGLGVVVDGRSAGPIAIAAVVYALGVAGLSVWLILGGRGHVKVNEGFLGPEGASLIVGFVGIVVLGSIATAFALIGLGVAWPATLATLACAAGLVIGGPALMRRLSVVMKRRGTGIR